MQQQTITAALSTEGLVLALQDTSCGEEKMGGRDCLTMLLRVAAALGLCGCLHLAAAGI